MGIVAFLTENLFDFHSPATILQVEGGIVYSERSQVATDDPPSFLSPHLKKKANFPIFDAFIPWHLGQ
jgi:hypothetical protein